MEINDLTSIPNDLWVAVHEHGSGADSYLFRFEGAIPAEPEEWIADKLAIDYEPEKGESLIVSPTVSRGQIPLLRTSESEGAAGG